MLLSSLSGSGDENDKKSSIFHTHITKSPSKKINTNGSSVKPTFKAVLFDMDGVLASVGNSYRQAIVQTGEHFGIKISHEDIAIEKKKGNKQQYNNLIML